MKHLLLAGALVASAAVFGQNSPSSNYNRLWDHIEKQEFTKAEQLITSGSIERDKAHDAYLTGIYLKAYRQAIDESSDFITSFYRQSVNPDPYVYALWFSPATLGPYGKKTKPHQIALIRALLENQKTFGTIRAGAHYQYGINYLFQNQFDSARMQYEQIGGIQNWQYVGPFENLSQSGIFKNYGPLENPDGKAGFSSLTHAKVKWFSPSNENPDGWIPFSNQIHHQTAVSYAQTFVTSSTDQVVLFNVGVTGAIRVWLNDAMILSETTERMTELDTYTVKCKLQKGVNRILVQMSYTQNAYPNFGLRITDLNYEPVAGIKGSNVFKPYTKTPQSPVPIKHFAEDFFQKKIESEPRNPLNYLLLADVYLRSKKTTDARSLLEAALEISKDNNLLRSKLIEVLKKEDNQTALLEELDNIRRTDPTAPAILDIDILNSVNTQKYNEALELVSKYENIYGEDLKTLQTRIGILAKQKKVTEMVALTESTFQKYPDDSRLIPVMHAIHSEIHRNKEAGMKVFDDYLARHYNHPLLKQYLQLLDQEGKSKLVAEKRIWMVTKFPFETSITVDNAQYHIKSKEYREAEDYLKKALDLSPYHEQAWELLGDVNREQNKKDEAIKAYQQSLQYDPNQYDVISKLRNLMGKPDAYKIVPQVIVDDIVAKDVPPATNLTSEAGYYVMEQDRSIVMHPGGATEEFDTYIVRITNENGIKEYKESTVSYSSSQNLFIEKYEVIKPSGAHIQGERNKNEIVFTNLEVGDIVVFQYRYQNFINGRFANDFWAKQFFQGSAYVAHSRYSLLLPASRKLNYLMTNSSMKPAISDVEDFRQYSWETTKQPAYNYEPYMPATVDVLPVLHISTLNSWSEISTWYADLINKTSEETFELTTAFQTLFSKDDLKTLTEFEKARRIYTYIQNNIRYSSVSFRQGAYRPQSASKTLSTRLGDCKDLSNLFMKLCEMAGIRTQMVLIDTGDNGEKDMVLPSLDFNHCIAKSLLDGKEYYIELTDRHLPFTSMPNNLIGALILEIPLKSDTKISELKILRTTTKSRDIAKADVVIRPSGNDVMVHTTQTKYGNPTSRVRNDFSNLSYDKQLIKLQEYIASQSKNISIDTLYFNDLESTIDSLTYTYRYSIKDEVSEIADLKTLKLIFPDLVATSNHFISQTREYPVNYNAYEDTDEYETTIRVELSKGQKFLDLPSDVTLSFKGMTYDLKYKVVNPELLLVTRKFTTNKSRVDVKDYISLKTFLDNIVKAEKRMIAFK
jgi:tetratricopeptide (TPR) repeat protein